MYMQEQLNTAKTEMSSARAEAEQLQSLAAAGDRSQGELDAKLSRQAAELRAAQQKVQQAQADAQQRLELCEAAQLQHTDAQATIRQLDAERDKLQCELDSKLETAAELEASLEQERGRIVLLQQEHQSLEQRLVHADRHMAQLQQEVEGGAEREDIARRDLTSLRQDYERLQVRPSLSASSTMRRVCCSHVAVRVSRPFKCTRGLCWSWQTALG